MRDELARLVAEDATPALLDGPDRATAPAGTAAEQPHDPLHDVISPAGLAALLANLDRDYPPGAFRFGSVEFDKASRLREQHNAALDRYRAILAESDFRFHVALTSGLLADLSFLDHATAMHRLEAIGAAESLRLNSPAEAILPLRRMFRVDALLAELKHVASRLTAARLRGEALRVAEAVAGHPRANQELLHRLHQLIGSQLSPWPPDANAWIGDRAMGLHAYEMVRDGQLLNLLTGDEIRRLGKQQDINSFVQAVTRSLDQDELFYLQSMRSIIESCSEPYYHRQPTIDAIATNLNQLQDTPHFPLFAAQVLLMDQEPGRRLQALAQGLRLQALDRARCEAFALALSAASGTAATPLPVNPVTGKPFELISREEQVEVRAIDGEEDGESFKIPRVIVTPP